MVGSQGPTGSVLWQTDPTQPGGYTQVTQLSPEQQQLYDSSMGAQNAALNLANQQIGRVGDALGQAFSYEGLPALVGSIQHQNATYSPIQAGSVYSPLAPMGGQGVSGIPGIEALIQSWMQTGQQAQQPNTAASQIGTGLGGITVSGGAPTVSSAGSFAPIQSTLAMGDPLQTGFAPGQAVQGQVAGGGPIQTGVDLSGNPQLATQFADVGGPQRQMGPSDFGIQRDQVTDAVFQQLMSRLNPEWDQREAQMRARLAAQGFSSANSQGYQNAYGTYARGRNDAEANALLTAIREGGAEQDRLFQESLAQGNFANAAQQQAFQQALARGEFGNEAAAAMFGQDLAAGQFANTAQQQQFAQNLAQGQFANDAAAQQYGQNQGLAEFYNNAQLAEFQRQLAAGQFSQQAQAQGAQQQLANAQLGNQAAQIANQHALGMGGLQVQGQGQALQAQIAQAQLAQQQQQLQAQIAQQQQNFLLDAIAQSNAAQGQVFGQGLAQQQLQNSVAAQNFGQDMGAAQFQNQARTQGAQELAYQQNLPLQQFSTLLGSGQLSMPQGIGYSPSSVAPTDVMGAYALQQNALQQQYQAQMRQQSGLMGGLFGLGSAILTAPMTGGGSLVGTLLGSDRATKTDILPVGAWKGLTVYSFRYKGDTTPRVGVMADEVEKLRPSAVKRIGPMVAVDYGELARAA